MIFVTVGASRPFDRLVREIDKIASETEYDFIAQIGNGTYIPRYVKYFRFKPLEEILKLMKKSDLIISHGGFGSILYSALCQRPIICVPKTFELDVTDNDQTELVKYFDQKGILKGVYDLNKLREAIQDIKFQPHDIEINYHISEQIGAFIEKYFSGERK